MEEIVKTIFFGSRQIDFFLSYKDRKSLGIKVHPNGKVFVSAPFETSEALILKRVKTKAPWIIKQIDHFLSFQPLTAQRKFLNGETHLYLGRQYKLKIVPSTFKEIKIFRGELQIYAKDISPASLQKQLNNWYKVKSNETFLKMFTSALEKFKRYEISVPELSIRFMEKRWGSCTPSGKIILNAELIKAPKGSIEYVILHELCHLIHPNHTKAFFELQEMIMPDWKKWKNKLEYILS